MIHSMSEDPRGIFEAIGVGMESDIKNNVYGRPGTEKIPYLHKKPTSAREILVAAYEMMRASGITLKVEYNHTEVDLDMTLAARDIRVQAQRERTNLE